MTDFPGAPRVLKAGLVLLDPSSSTVERVITLQYNPATLTRTLQPQHIGGDSQSRAGPMRLKGPPVETIKLEAEIDAADQLEEAGTGATVTRHGISPQLAALETIIYPASSDLQANNDLAAAGTLEVAPPEGPLVLFIWSASRVLPVKLTELSITEEAFDPELNPLRAKVNLGLQVLSVKDLGFDHKGGSLFMTYHQSLERLADKDQEGSLSDMGLRGVP
jgi:hypothetical protein